MLKSVTSSFNKNIFKERCQRLLMVRYWCSNVQPKPNKDPHNRDSKKKSNWKFYPNDLVFKNLKPDSVPQHYKMVYRSSVETITNMSILVNSTAVLGFPAFFLSSTGFELPEIASLESTQFV